MRQEWRDTEWMGGWVDGGWGGFTKVGWWVGGAIRDVGEAADEREEF